MCVSESCVCLCVCVCVSVGVLLCMCVFHCKCVCLYVLAPCSYTVRLYRCLEGECIYSCLHIVPLRGRKKELRCYHIIFWFAAQEVNSVALRECILLSWYIMRYSFNLMVSLSWIVLCSFIFCHSVCVWFFLCVFLHAFKNNCAYMCFIWSFVFCFGEKCVCVELCCICLRAVRFKIFFFYLMFSCLL